MNTQSSDQHEPIVVILLYIFLGTPVMLLSFAMVLNWRGIALKYTILLGETIMRRNYPAKLVGDLWKNRVVFAVMGLLSAAMVLAGLSGLVDLIA